MSIATRQIEVGASPNYELVWCSIGDWCRYVNGWEFGELRMAVYVESEARPTEIAEALKRLSRLERDRNRWVVEQFAPAKRQSLPRAIPLACIGLFVVLFWSAACLQLAEWFWEVVR